MSATAAQACQTIVDELLKTRVADLSDRSHTENKLAELNRALREVQAFAESIQALIQNFQPGSRGPGRPRKPQTFSRVPARPAGGGHRGPGDFPAKAFVLEAVQAAGPSGIRPRDVVAKVVAEAPGRHVRPSALVSTILARLKRERLVRSRAGRWSVAQA